MRVATVVAGILIFLALFALLIASLPRCNDSNAVCTLYSYAVVGGTLIILFILACIAMIALAMAREEEMEKKWLSS